MKQEEIKTLSGRKLDGAIAEHIYGWSEIDNYAGVWKGYASDPWLCEIYNYSSDILFAWKLVERLIEMGWNFRLESISGGMWAQFNQRGNFEHMRKIASTSGDDAAEAICRAALLAHFQAD